MIIYKLKGNTVIAEFDAGNYTCMQSKWHCEITRYIEKRLGDLSNFAYLIVGSVLNTKTSFSGRAKFDEVTSITEAREYAKSNLLNLYKKVTLECLDAVLIKLARATDKIAKLIVEVRK